MITERGSLKDQKGYMPYLHSRIKYKSVTVTGMGRRLNHSIKKKTFLNVFPKSKQNKQRQTKMEEIKEEICLNCTTIIKYAFCFLACL